MRKKRDKYTLSKEYRKELQEKYKEVLNHPMWTFVRNSVRIIRPYTTRDFEREYFIPTITYTEKGVIIR